ncbi:MAG: hypothetical protein CFH06_00463 [Alphaproteobacteria bacterium MarineAlpha3_Bin5]|nr:hypothetical protein [Magnetovibrio sp.]PPR79246.1 MAG: hypothetical protein CFH06_00463 [Alphaproteobacteria bacterium MarineAlpha3_Bin5]
MSGASPTVCLITDFGTEDPYVGQVKGVVSQLCGDINIIDLFHGVPKYNAKALAYLLPNLVQTFTSGTVFLCVVDPGVGSERPASVLEVDGRWFVGPGNGIFELLSRRSKKQSRWWEIVWSPPHLSASFHGRDLFAPIASFLAIGGNPEDEGRCKRKKGTESHYAHWPDDLAEIVYIDTFSNAIIGYRWKFIAESWRIIIGGHDLARGRTFSDLPPGTPFCYENSMGLLEIAMNQGRAAEFLNLFVGSSITFQDTV